MATWIPALVACAARDEGHDFAPEWLKLITQMAVPTTNSLLGAVRRCAKQLRTRAQQTVQLQKRGVPCAWAHHNPEDQPPQHATDSAIASLIAVSLPTADDKNDDGIPLFEPVNCG